MLAQALAVWNTGGEAGRRQRTLSPPLIHHLFRYCRPGEDNREQDQPKSLPSQRREEGREQDK